MRISTIFKSLHHWALLLRWNKPSGRLILLIPAGWSLWMAPSAPPSGRLITLIIAGGIAISGAGCIANDLWDRHIDKQVTRTNQRPLAKGTVQIATAWKLLVAMLCISLLTVMSLPESSKNICLAISIFALPLILIYPTAKRWFAYPQALLSICWGFAVLIPWAASESSINGGLPLLLCWGATLTWTFGFDTVYAMADSNDDKKLGLKSSVLSLGENAIKTVTSSYLLTAIFIGSGAYFAQIGLLFWPFWLLASIGMQREIFILKNSNLQMSIFGRHFKNQVFMGGLILLGLVLGKI